MTFRGRSGPSLFTCDGSGWGSRPWCGRAFGRLRAGRLLDPRLDLAPCPTVKDPVLGFAWGEPSRLARYVVVRHDDFAEAYPSAARLPIRIATRSGVDVSRSAATVEISEHDRRGRMLREYELRAVVAG